MVIPHPFSIAAGDSEVFTFAAGDSEVFTFAAGDSEVFTFTADDVNGNPLPSETTIKVTTTCKEVTLSGDADVTLPDAVNGRIYFSVTAFSYDVEDVDEVGSCSMTFEVTGTDADGNGFGSTTVSGEIR
ncbi:MAG: hypothetical protein JRG71_13005 [Deltaproteobacteria bacterium]|nr:hypothetical protein [Deltaproteobacteria bacterium]